MDPKKLNSYVGVVNQPPPKWSSVKKWLLHINYAPGYAPEPEQKPVCRQFSRCEGCPYPSHGFLCWGSEDDCMRTRMKKLNEKETEHEDQSGLVYPEDSHVGIVGGRDESGNLLIIHCASGYNNVVITGIEGFTSIGRPVYFSD
ncbi:hypothetical protein [Pseudoflavonifractor phocaeensis]|uniref:hypothetical protein n=1 Tax=Pseudoflavonifractor phocaeensis TaxID=1870988 RepID=UPI001956C5C5|nr:hypothetical protein [Pseudoflavonifractor phocaeensis]